MWKHLSFALLFWFQNICFRKVKLYFYYWLVSNFDFSSPLNLFTNLVPQLYQILWMWSTSPDWNTNCYNKKNWLSRITFWLDMKRCVEESTLTFFCSLFNQIWHSTFFLTFKSELGDHIYKIWHDWLTKFKGN